MIGGDYADGMMFTYEGCDSPNTAGTRSATTSTTTNRRSISARPLLPRNESRSPPPAPKLDEDDYMGRDATCTPCDSPGYSTLLQDSEGQQASHAPSEISELQDQLQHHQREIDSLKQRSDKLVDTEGKLAGSLMEIEQLKVQSATSAQENDFLKQRVALLEAKLQEKEELCLQQASLLRRSSRTICTESCAPIPTERGCCVMC
eukprot:TRINITY_DN8403_c0_g1_i2.p2 TRINITY_DN8403_c0_g1~~TRINITY_DN8403_c0_g1_i2.p2  ORF type:complete len:204 (+),score=79.13 TRINITY_DN8403_c0_g1_i2:148-759(+)